MRVKIYSVLTVIFFMLFTFSSCGAENKSSIVHYISAEPETLDPQTAKDENSLLLVANTFEGLMRLDENSVPQPALCESYSYDESSLTYRFELKEGLKWSDGRDLTANDFVFAFKRLFDKETGAPDVERFYCINNGNAVYAGTLGSNHLGVSADGDRTVVFKLDYNYHGFLELLTRPQAMPCNEEFFVSTKGKYGLEQNKVLSNGALTVYAWYHNESLFLKKNTYYYSPKSVPKVVSLYINSEAADSESLFTDGGNDVFISWKKLGGKYEFYKYSSKTYGLLFNTESEVFGNLKLRKALSLAFNRDSFREKLPEGYRPDNSFCYVENENYSYNTEKARETLEDAYKELSIGKIYNPKIICRKGTVHKEILSFALQYWQENLDLYFVVVELDDGDYESALKNKIYDVILTDFSYIEDGGLKFVSSVKDRVSDPSIVDNYIDNYYLCDNGDEAKDNLQKAIKIIADEVIFIPTYSADKYLYVGKGVQNITFNRNTLVIDFTKAKK